MGMPFEPALKFINKTLIRQDIRDKIRVRCSDKIISSYSMLRAVAMKADMCNCVRSFMFSLRCNNSTSPTGIATQDKMLKKIDYDR
jgi:glutamate synthase domain-containing protein 2